MVKIRRFPSEAIISGFKGSLDYYEHNGVACVRTWPRSPGHARSAAVTAQWPLFAYASRSWTALTPALQTLYNHQATGTILTGRDLFTRSYLSGAFTYPTGAP